jgi:hypothetical protein
MQISVTIQNTGTVVDGLATIDFYAGDPKKQGQRIAGQEMILDSNYRETTVSVDWVAKKAREQQIFVIVDPQQKIADLNRENNQAVAKINIRPKSAQAIDPTLAVKKLGPNRYQIGAVLVDTESGTVSIPGQINIISPETILEFFACTGRGKTHESLVMVEAEPIHIQLGLLRLNMNPGMNLTAQGDPHTPTGDPADIWVDWQRAGEMVRLRAEDLIWNAVDDREMQKTNWIFTGARIKNNQFTAQLFYSIIALYRDPDAIMNHPLLGGTDDRTFRVNPSTIPAKGTPVTVTIQRIKDT